MADISTRDGKDGSLENLEEKNQSNYGSPTLAASGSADPTAPEVHDMNYRTMHWLNCALIMAAETVSLGILCLPWAIAKFGLIQGVVIIQVTGWVAMYSGHVIGNFMGEFKQVEDFADAGAILFGKRWHNWGYFIFATCYVVVLIKIMAAHIVSFQVMMLTVTRNTKICALFWAVVGTVVQFIFNMPRTMKQQSIISIGSSLSVLIAVILVIWDTSRRTPDSPALMTKPVPGTTLSGQITGLMNIILAYAGHIAYFSFHAELKNPNDFNKALYVQLSIATVMYTISGALIYKYVGTSVKSLALSSASPFWAKVAFGTASFTIVLAGVVNAHVMCKFIYKRGWFKRFSQRKGVVAHLVWNGISLVGWILAFLLSVAIPSFPHMLAMSSALFMSWIGFGLPGWLWLRMHQGELRTSKTRMAQSVLHVLLLMLGIFLAVLGLYGAAVELKEGKMGRAFDCKQNFESAGLDKLVAEANGLGKRRC